MRIILFLCLFLLCGCWGTRGLEEQYLYDKVGFKGNRRPVTNNYESKKIHSVVPDRRNYYNGYNGAPPMVGGSRFYVNPYAIPAAQPVTGYSHQGYYPYRAYDADRYYVAPNSYRYIEKPEGYGNQQVIN